MIEYEISSTANALGDGAYISNVRAGQRDFTIQAKTTNPRNNAILRNGVTSFFNSKKPYKVYLTYLGRTRWFEGYINKLNIPTANIHRPLELTIIFTAATPYLRSVDEFGKNIAAIQAMAGFPYLCNPDFGGAPTGLFEFSENVILNNDGDVDTYCKVVIKARGDVVNPKIIIGDKYVRIIDIMEDGDVITIDFTANPPTVQKNGVNFIGNTDKTSSFIGMELAVGDTEVSFDADDGTNLMEVQLFYNKLYWTM